MSKKLGFKFAVTLLKGILLILLLCNLTQGVGAEEEEKFYLFEGADLTYLTKVRGPNGFFVKSFLWLPGSNDSWETMLLGDIAGERYGIGIFLASFSTTKFRVEFIVEQDGVETIVASDFVTADSTTFMRFKREFGGKDPQTKAGDKLILRISHVNGDGGAVLYGGGPGDDSYITAPPIIASKSDTPLAGKWKGTTTGEDGGTTSFIITGDRKFVRDFTIRTNAHSQGNGNAIEFEEKVEDAIKNKDNIFRIKKDSLSVEGTFISETRAVGNWVYSADLGEGLDGCYTAAGTWKASFDSMAVTPKNRLVTTWGKVKKGL